ncbi:MAG: hypothetical protein LBG11_10665 [Bifidobacteriaceae bacterium]|nr:hypothetical protein [Bifidobacteriaceae bacterium]
MTDGAALTPAALRQMVPTTIEAPTPVEAAAGRTSGTALELRAAHETVGGNPGKKRPEVASPPEPVTEPTAAQPAAA